MNLRQLEIFRAVMITGSTVDAAKMLLVSQPAVSNAILHFEDQLKFKLFERIKGRLNPTAEAEILFSGSEKVFTNFNMVQELVQKLQDCRTGSLRIVTSPSIGQTIMPSRIAAMMHDYPRIKIYFELWEYASIIEQIATQQQDLAFTLRPSDHPLIQSRTLATGHMVCVLHKDNPLCERKVIRPTMLCDQPLVVSVRSAGDGRFFLLA